MRQTDRETKLSKRLGGGKGEGCFPSADLAAREKSQAVRLCEGRDSAAMNLSTRRSSRAVVVTCRVGATIEIYRPRRQKQGSQAEEVVGL